MKFINMKEIKIREEDEFIKLGQLLKKAGIVSSGIEAKILIEEGNIKVNYELENRRGRKVRENDIVSGENWNIKVVK